MNDDYAHSTDDLAPHEQKTFYVLCDPQGRQAVDPFDGAVTNINRPSLADAVGEFRRDDPSRDEANLHVVMVRYTNLGPLREVQAPKTTEPSEMPIPEVEHPIRGSVGDLQGVFDALDLVLGMTMKAIAHRLADDEYPPAVQDDSLTLLLTIQYLNRLTKLGHCLVSAQRQPARPVEAIASVSLTGSSQ